ncbi:MAG: ComF family protein [Thermodesulfobacteriota bacterium]|nr:ComF family protein [Thermodesulfobacteriota bacterium]
MIVSVFPRPDKMFDKIRILRSLGDLIYPPRCVSCEAFLGHSFAEEEARISLCSSCRGDLLKLDSPLCPICSTPFSSEVREDHLCEDCIRKRPFYEAAGAPFLFKGVLKDAIHKIKYGGKSHIADSLGPLLARFAEEWVRDSHGLITIPVPLHPKRLRQRGFNQALLLARYVAKRLETDLDFLSLRRLRHTVPQTGLGKRERAKNVRGAFVVTDPEAVKGKTALIVDDVSTTGNTLNECAKTLKKSGCDKVLCLVLAKAPGP